MKNNVKIQINKEEGFKPINIQLNFCIESQEQLDNLRLEFSEGQFSETYSEHSMIIGGICEHLSKI